MVRFKDTSTNWVSANTRSCSPYWECTGITDESFHPLTGALSPWFDPVFASVLWTDSHFSGYEAFPGMLELNSGWTHHLAVTLHTELCQNPETDALSYEGFLKICFLFFLLLWIVSNVSGSIGVFSIFRINCLKWFALMIYV